jgi:2-polyprenyl-3-methyl-5-hydroxy-6-metoxy-1,4-benzoquinol methylase
MNELKSNLINCPICDSKNHEVFYEKTYRFWNKSECFVWPAQQVICKSCGMIFTNPQPTSETLKWFYESDQRFGESSSHFRELQVKFIQNNVSQDCKTIFDIGAFNGKFLDILKGKGYEVFGIEPSEEGVQQALDHYDIKLINGFFNEEILKTLDDKFDVVTIRHVLEHIQSPLDFLKCVIRVTNQNKYIFIEVPDASRPFSDNVADFFSNQHIMHFTEGSLINIANVLGLKIVTIEKVQNIPIIRILLKNESAKICRLKNEYEINKKIMIEYETKKQNFMRNLKSKIPHSIEEVIIYGAGMHTTQLIQSGLLDNIKIDSIVDSNPKKHGTFFEGQIIQSPKIIMDKNIPVLISSYDSQEEISDYLNNVFPHITLIKLYDKIVSYDNGIC